MRKHGYHRTATARSLGLTRRGLAEAPAARTSTARVTSSPTP